MCNVYINIYNEICNGIVKEKRKEKVKKNKVNTRVFQRKGDHFVTSPPSFLQLSP